MLALGIDVGGTKTAIGIIDTANGQIVERLVLPTPQPKAKSAFLADIVAAAEKLDLEHSLPIGVGLCELVTNQSQIASAWRVEWSAAEVKHAFAKWPVLTLEADVRAAAIAEAHFGAGRGISNWIYANAGTGIATVLMHGGTPHRGANGLGMAWGMSPANLNPAGVTRIDNLPTSIEAICGGAGLLESAVTLGLDVPDIAALAGTSDNRAINLLSHAGQTLGRGLGTLANMLDPEAIILGGGVALASKTYCDGCKDGLRHAIWPQGRQLPNVMVAELRSHAGLIGAAFIAARSVKP